MGFSWVAILISYVFLGLVNTFWQDKENNQIFGRIYLSTDSLVTFGLFWVNFASTWAIFSWISICLSNFPQDTHLLFPIIIVAHLSTTRNFDYTVKNIFFGSLNNSNFSIFLYITGAYVGILTFLISLLIRKREIKNTFVRLFSPDSFGVTIMVFVDALFIECLIASQLIENNYFVTFIVFIIGLFFSLLSLYFFRRLMKSQAMKLGALKFSKKLVEVPLSECIKDSKFILLCIVSAVVKGTSVTSTYHIQEIGLMLNKFDQVENMAKTMWILTITSIFLGGIMVIFFRKTIHAYFFLSLAPLLWLFNFYYFIGIGYGIWSIVIPQIILSAGGTLNFIQTWGFVFIWDFIGIWLMEYVYIQIVNWKYEYSLFTYFMLCSLLNFALFILCWIKYWKRKPTKTEKKEEKKQRKLDNKQRKLDKKKNKDGKKSKKKNLKRNFTALNLRSLDKLKL